MTTNSDRCPKCNGERLGSISESLCPRCLNLKVMTVDAPTPADPEATTAPPSRSPGRSPQRTWSEPEATGDYVPAPAADNALVRAGVTADWKPGSTVPEATTQSPEVPRDLPRGHFLRTFGDYELEREISRGGMGVVYQARQVKLNRTVALKMILAGKLAGEAEVRRFYLEAEAAASLDHPGIVPIYEFGQHEGHHYFSMAFVKGQSLAQKVSHGPLPPLEAAALTIQIAEAVQYAHERGVIHRDLKPGNVLLDAQGRPKVADFGLAKKLETDSGLTGSGQVLGTPSYMPPEQAQGLADIGPLADVYSLGAMLYCLLTGRPPFQAASAMDTVLQVLERDPPRPRSLNAAIPADLETIALKCLAKEPWKRYASALALAEDLGRFLDSKPILARPTPAWEHGWKWSRRHPVAATLAALGLVASIGLAWAVEYRNADLRQQAAQEDSRVDGVRRDALNALLKAQDQIARGELEEARLALARLETTLKSEPRLDVLLGNVSAALDEARRRLDDRNHRAADQERLVRFEKLCDVALFEDARSVGFDPLGRLDQDRISARDALGVFWTLDAGKGWTLGPMPASFDESGREKVASGSYLMLLVLAEAIARPLPGEDARRQASEALGLLDRASTLRLPTQSYRIRRAACLERAGDAEAARLEQAEAERMEPAGAFDRLLLGQQLYRDGDIPAALRQFASALQSQPDLFWAQCLTAICSLKSFPARPSEAWTALNACLQQKPDYAWLYLLRGSASGQMGTRDVAAARKVEAEAHFADAEADFRVAMKMGLDADLRYTLFMNRGVMRYQGGRTAEAIADFEQGIALDGSRYNAHASLAQAFARMDRRAEAIGQLDQAIGRKPDMAALYRERAILRGEATTAEIELALSDLDEAIRREPSRSRDAAADHGLRGRLLLKLDRHTEALAACEAALAVTPDLASASRYRAAALLELGRFDEVLTSCDAILAHGPPSVEVYELRGLARVGRNNFAGAIDDYTHALGLSPDRVSTLHYRGLAYLFANSPELALHDFEESVRLAPGDPEGYGGRAAAKVRLKRHREAALDAEESLRRREPTRERLYDAARTYALATAVAASEVVRRGRPALRESLAYEARAADLLAQALKKTPTNRRESFWRDIVERDDAMAKLRNRRDLAPKPRSDQGP